MQCGLATAAVTQVKVINTATCRMPFNSVQHVHVWHNYYYYYYDDNGVSVNFSFPLISGAVKWSVNLRLFIYNKFSPNHYLPAFQRVKHYS